jgi:hypothetical protein
LVCDAVKSYTGRQEPEVLTRPKQVVNAVSMEEAVQPQQEGEA